jgi:hypothetical protein
MHATAISFVLWSSLFGLDCLPVGELIMPAARLREPARVEPYMPREGDLVFYDDRSVVWTPLFAMAGTGPPLHMGMVVRKADGSFAVLEAGPDDAVWVKLLDLGPRLKQFHDDFPRGTISIRRCKVPLTAERSAALTNFANAQNGKRYAVLRLLAQGTSLRARGPLAPMLAKTDLTRDSWMCSELSVACAAVAGLLDGNQIHANATYPRDLVNNEYHDLGATWEGAAEWRPCAKMKANPGVR